MYGVANQKGFGVGIVLVSPKKIVVEKSLWLCFSATNNEAEYEILLVGMAMVGRLGGEVVEVSSGKLMENLRLEINECKGISLKLGVPSLALKVSL